MSIFIYISITSFQGFCSSSDSKASACNAGDLGSISGSEDPLEKEMATHSSILAWRIPWIEEPYGLQSMGSQRVGQDGLTHIQPAFKKSSLNKIISILPLNALCYHTNLVKSLHTTTSNNFLTQYYIRKDTIFFSW